MCSRITRSINYGFIVNATQIKSAEHGLQFDSQNYKL